MSRAGSYPQQLVINKNLSIVGTGGTVAIDPSTLPTADTDTDSSTSQYAIVDVTSGASVTLRNLRSTARTHNRSSPGVDRTSWGCTTTTLGRDEERHRAKCRVGAGDFGCQDGLGVYVASDSGDHSTVIMTGDTVRHYDKNGITCDDAGTTCTVQSSTVTGIGSRRSIAQNGIQAVDAASIDLDQRHRSRTTPTPEADWATKRRVS